ncbi:MAG: NADH-quinone oxidoreductase subunit G [Actinomycetota bacterium]
MTASESADDVTLEVDGKQVTVPKGTLIIRAAEQLGIEIPRFCDHPLLEPVGACRQCYVEVEGQRKLLTSCTTPVAPGMEVRTQYASEQVREAQEATLEFLLLNHPLDCPVCDRGGECPLQDQTMKYGPGESRYVEAKRTFPKPVPLSPLVALDRERCVLCARCTRFCDEISGDRFIELFDRGAQQQVSIAGGEDFDSPFSGNTIQICPVGALTATSYRFVARPYDLSHTDTVCDHCSAGCNIRVDLRRGEMVRVLARDNLEVNDAWICDKGRFAFRAADAEDRVTVPMIRDHGLEPASFDEIFEAIADWTRGARVAFLTGGRLTDESAYALSKLARTVFATDDVDHRRTGGTSGEVDRFSATPGGFHVTYRDVEQAKVILLAGLDAEQEVPILHLRIRKAARRGAKVFVLHPRRTRLHDVAEHLLVAPGQEGVRLRAIAEALRTDPSSDPVAAALAAAGEEAVVLAGPRLADAPGAAAEAASLAMAAEIGFANISRRANDHGALRAGLAPGLYPGGRTSEEIAELWGTTPPTSGRSTREILEACDRHEVDVLFLIGIDPLRDLPDAALAERAIGNVRHKVVQDLSPGSLANYADAFLPVAASIETDGHRTTWEGRGQRLRPVRDPEGNAQQDWEIFARLARAVGGDLGFSTLDELRVELGRALAPREVRPFDFAADAADAESNPSGPPAPEALILFTYSLLVDEGRLSEGATELKSAQERAPFVEVHADDAARLDITDGASVTVTTDAGVATLPASVTDAIALGTVFVPYNQPGFAANTLLSGAFTAGATLTSADAGVADLDSAPDAIGATPAAAATGGEG